MKSTSFCGIIICLTLLVTARTRVTAQIQGFVPMTDTVTVLAAGDIPPSINYSISTSSEGIDSVQITAHDFLFAGSPVPSNRIASCSFLVQDTAGLNVYELWLVIESAADTTRTRIPRDQGTTVWPGQGYLMLRVSVGGSFLDSLKVHVVVMWFPDAIDEEAAELPDRAELKLIQNYPNPFNGQTTFQYYLPTAGSTEFAVYDNLGRLVRKISEGTRSPGTHRITFMADNLPSGIYILLLRTSTRAATRTMVLIR